MNSLALTFIISLMLLGHPVLAESFNLPAGEKFKLDDGWNSYTSKKILENVSPYPLLENRGHEGLLGVLNTEVKFFNPSKEKGMLSWFKGECDKLKKLYINGVVKFHDKKFCRVETLSSHNQKAMIQYLKAKEIDNPKAKSMNKVFIYTYSFYLPKKSDLKSTEKAKMIEAVEQLMGSNL